MCFRYQVSFIKSSIFRPKLTDTSTFLLDCHQITCCNWYGDNFFHSSQAVSSFPDFSNFFVLVSGEVRVSRTTFKWVRLQNEAQLRGKIWFTSCFSLSPHSTCMVYPVTIKFVARKEGKEDVELASVTIMPARDSFPVDGLLGSARALWLVESWELGIRVNCKGNKINSDDEYYEPVSKRYVAALVSLNMTGFNFATAESGFRLRQNHIRVEAKCLWTPYMHLF